MGLELTEDQAFFVDTTRRFLEAECGIRTVRHLEDDPLGDEANRLLVHERLAVGGGSPYTAGRCSKHEVGDDESELVPGELRR